jgi:hypothetical protein
VRERGQIWVKWLVLLVKIIVNGIPGESAESGHKKFRNSTFDGKAAETEGVAGGWRGWQSGKKT